MRCPLLRKHSDRSRSAPDAHQPLLSSVHNWRFASLDSQFRASVHSQIDRFPVAQAQQSVASDATFILGPAGQVFDASKREHLRSVFACGHMAHRFAFSPNDIALLADIAIRIDFHLRAAVAENALGHHCNHIHAFDFLAHDERRRLVVRVCCSGADRSHERPTSLHQIAVPVRARLVEQKWN